VIELIRQTISRVDFPNAFDTLDYLRRGEGIGHAQAFWGSMLRVNPLITLRDGAVEAAGRAYSQVKAIDHLYDFAMSHSYIEAIAIEDAAFPIDADLLVDGLGPKFPERLIYCSKTTPIIGTHTGLGLLLLAV
jgi:fatty acid-binding protein DegV